MAVHSRRSNPVSIHQDCRHSKWPGRLGLGVVIYSGLSMSNHVTALCRSVYYQLCQSRMIVRSLSDDAKNTLVQSFVSCLLDYCNALLFGISGGLIQRLQSVQARLITGASRRDHITPVLRQLHWLPVWNRELTSNRRCLATGVSL